MQTKYNLKGAPWGGMYAIPQLINTFENAETHEGGADIQFGRFLDELGWEFNQEGRRRQDMIRFGIYTKKSFFAHNPNGTNKTIYPILRGRLETNSNMVQNPGY